MSEPQISFEWLPTPQERVSQAAYLLRRPFWRRIMKTIGIFLLFMAIVTAWQAATASLSSSSILDWGWVLFWLVCSVGFLFRPAFVFPFSDGATPLMARRLTIDDAGILIQNLGLRLYPHRVHWSRLGPLEAFESGYGVYVDGGYAAFWIPRRVLADRETEFCDFVAAHCARRRQVRPHESI
jgi:hypothetical protein